MSGKLELPVAGRASRLERPEWLKVRLNTTGEYDEVRRMMRRLSLVTVCEEARCPNIHECWARERTATFMLLGDVCTRHCGFCAVGKGRPGALDPEEPERVAEAARELGLSHAVVTSVNRDDLPDGGAAHFAETIRAIRRRNPELHGRGPDPGLPGRRGRARRGPRRRSGDPEPQRRDRRRASTGACGRTRSTRNRWLSSRAPPSIASRRGLPMRTKSGLMVGLGESMEELLATLADLRASGCDIATVGQYLQPHERRLPIERYYTPEEFSEIRERAEAMGFQRVEAGPLVRSSYHARRAFDGPAA